MTKPSAKCVDGWRSKSLALLAESGRCIRLDDIVAELGAPGRSTVSAAMCALIKAKYVERDAPGCFRVTRAGIEANKAGLRPGPRGPQRLLRAPKEEHPLRSRVWRALRLKPRVSVDDLVTLAGEPGANEVYENNRVRRYLLALVEGGYVQRFEGRVRPANSPRGSTGFYLYRLRPERNTGPLAPVLMGKTGRRRLRDANTGDVIELAAVKP